MRLQKSPSKILKYPSRVVLNSKLLPQTLHPVCKHLRVAAPGKRRITFYKIQVYPLARECNLLKLFDQILITFLNGKVERLSYWAGIAQGAECFEVDFAL